jgi:hypothetical protein
MRYTVAADGSGRFIDARACRRRALDCPFRLGIDPRPADRLAALGALRSGLAHARNDPLGKPLYVEQCLVHTLKRNDIVVTDNFPARRVAGAPEAIERAGATLRYLPKFA